MAGARVVLRGRFRAGDVVELFEVAGEHVLRVDGDARLVDRKLVGVDGVAFSSGVREGGRYIIRGISGGQPLEVRVRGNAEGEESSVLAQAPVGAERTKRADGSWDDEHVPAPSVPEEFLDDPAPEPEPERKAPARRAAQKPAAKKTSGAKPKTTKKSADKAAGKE